MTAFVIDPEIQSYLREQTPEEYATFSRIIIEGGYVDSLVILDINGLCVLGDGHHRMRICDENGIEYPTRTIKFDSREAAVEWVIENQLGRRNLTPEERAYFIGKQYLHKKKDRGGRENFSKDQNDPLAETLEISENAAEFVAEKNHVSEPTVKRNAAFAEAVDKIASEEGPQARKTILAGESGQTKKEIIAAAPTMCPKCTRNATFGRPNRPDCEDCKALKKSPKKTSDEPKDRNGTPWPKTALPAIEANRQLNDFRVEVNALKEKASELSQGQLANHIDWKAIASSLEDIRKACLNGKPDYVCPYCEGEKDCRMCKGSGWVPEHIWKESPAAVECDVD